MKAAIRRSYCGPDGITVEDIELPQLKPNEVKVKVKATTVNRTDCAILTGKPLIMHLVSGFLKPKKITLGTDIAGIVESVGQEVKSIEVGDRVCYFNDMGISSQATHSNLKASGILRIPKNIDFKSAAAALEGAHYAYTFIKKTSIQKGQKVLVNGATGAIGSAVIQFVREFDVEITATCREKDVDLVKGLGSDKVIDYTKVDFTTQKVNYDYILDSVGKSTFGKSKRVLNDSGIYVSSELGPYSQNLFLSLITPIIGGKKVLFPVPFPMKESMPFILEKLESGTFKPVIDKEFELENIGEAYQYAISGQKVGNIIINLDK